MKPDAMNGDPSSASGQAKNPWLLRIGLAAALLLLAAGIYWLSQGLKGNDRPQRQVAKISILPDTPPPPPPPKEEKRPEPPKEEPKQVMPDTVNKPADVPKAAESLKMEGAAGDGPSAFAAGNVRNEYTAGPTGGASGPGTGTSSDRAQERFYANTARQLLRDEIERRLRSEADQLTATFAIWLGKDGAIQRFELSPTGDAQHDDALRAALDETSRQFKLPPPPPVAQPMRFRVSVRPQA